MRERERERPVRCWGKRRPRTEALPGAAGGVAVASARIADTERQNSTAVPPSACPGVVSAVRPGPRENRARAVAWDFEPGLGCGLGRLS